MPTNQDNMVLTDLFIGKYPHKDPIPTITAEAVARKVIHKPGSPSSRLHSVYDE